MSANRAKRGSAFKGKYELENYSELDTDNDDDVPMTKKNKPRTSTGQKRTKECPGCSAHVSQSIRECPHCDYMFTAKTLNVGTNGMNQSYHAQQESRSIRSTFPFEPEREED